MAYTWIQAIVLTGLLQLTLVLSLPILPMQNTQPTPQPKAMTRSLSHSLLIWQ